MSNRIDPKTFGLHPSTRIEQTAENEYILVINRKSRIIMKDGRGILSKVQKIRAKSGDAVVSVRTTAPVCSKTKAFLEKNDIPVALMPPEIG